MTLDRVVDRGTDWSDTGKVCALGSALVHPLGSLTKNEPHRALIIAEGTSALCAEEAAWEAELGAARVKRNASALGEGRAPEITDARVRAERAHTVAAARFEAAFQQAQEAFGPIGAGDCPHVGRRDEFYPVTQAFAALPVLQIERAAVPHFGVLAFGVHMNAFVRTRNGLQMWVARRAADKPTFPGMLDNAVAGGQPIGIGLRENLLKECHEEAGIPPEIAQRATSVGALSYCKETRNGLKPDVLYCFDLELPADFVPSNTDGEVEEFLLWPITRVAETVRDSQAFKPNCNLVIIDFLVRHGVIPPEHRDYLPICLGLRR